MRRGRDTGVTRLKALARGGSAQPIDWVAGVFTFCSSAALAGLAVFKPAAVQHMGIVAILFGIIGMRLALSELWRFVRKPTDKMFWWYTHLGNMIGSYIAAWTAFSVVTLPLIFGPSILLWLWPTLIGVPAIVLTTGYYKRKFAPKVKLAIS